MAPYISAGVRARWPGKTVSQRRISSASVKMGSLVEHKFTLKHRSTVGWALEPTRSCRCTPQHVREAATDRTVIPRGHKCPPYLGYAGKARRCALSSSLNKRTARASSAAWSCIASPAALALIPATFPDPAKRARAMWVYAAMSVVGAAAGLVVGGMLTEWASWRWVFLLAVPFALALLAAAPAALPEPPRRRGNLSVTSAVLVTAAVATLVYGVSRTPAVGWVDAGSLGWIAAATGLTAAFVLLEARRATPLLPKAQLPPKRRRLPMLRRRSSKSRPAGSAMLQVTPRLPAA